MNKKIRLIILFACITLFFLIAPILITYSMGYRFDFERGKVVATGGIYVRTFPSGEEVVIDSKISRKPALFANSVFVQSLLPKSHTVFVKKEGYYDYYKNLMVQENQVTKLEDVLLFKKDILFESILDQSQSPFISQEKFLIKNNNLYYSSVPENADLTSTQKSTPVLKNLVAFARQNNDIIWLGVDGFLYKSNLSNLPAVPAKLVLTPLKINKKNTYKIVADSKYIFVDNNGNLLFLNEKTNSLDNFNALAEDAKISPDNENIVYFNGKNVYISSLPLNETSKNALLYESKEKITDCVWLNNDYIIIASANEIVISEIDYRGNVNSITLPQTIAVSDKNIVVKNPEISFNQQNGKLYILTNDTLLMSEKITP